MRHDILEPNHADMHIRNFFLELQYASCPKKQYTREIFSILQTWDEKKVLE